MSVPAEATTFFWLALTIWRHKTKSEDESKQLTIETIEQQANKGEGSCSIERTKKENNLIDYHSIALKGIPEDLKISLIPRQINNNHGSSIAESQFLDVLGVHVCELYG